MNCGHIEKVKWIFVKDCVKCSLLILLDSSNFVETLCDSWVLSASVWVARSPVDFCYATTEAERRPLVVSVPLLLRTQLARAAQEVRGTSDLRGPEWNGEPRDAKFFYWITEAKKSQQTHSFSSHNLSIFTPVESPHQQQTTPLLYVSQNLRQHSRPCDEYF